MLTIGIAMLSRFKKWPSDKRAARVLACLAAFSVLGLVSMPGCKENPAPKIDFGSVKNSVYRNQYFGLTVQFPEGWTILDQEAQQQRQQRGVSVLAGNDPALRKTLNAAEMQSLPLFAAYVRPLGSPPPNPNISGVAARLSGEVNGPRDYLASARELFKAGQMTVSFPKEIYMQKISGADFAVLELEFLIDGKKAKQKQYCTFAKGYSLGFVISFTTDRDEALLRNVMESMRFDSTPAPKSASGKAPPPR